MANPRVFISSTCYDLASERDSLIDFCRGFGFDVALSERGDVFFHPDLHTHEACISEVGNCHLLVLIIGGRFGGRYVVDPSKSITNAEYAAAREAGIPVFTFIKSDVLQDHNLWQSNKAAEFVNKINYPSIDKQSHSISIFKFIDEIRLAKNNNSYFPFSLPREIHEQLRKQWAAMFLEGIRDRSITKQLVATNDALTLLTSVSQKIEELAKSIYKNVDSAEAETSIRAIDSLAEARKMFHLIASRVSDKEFLSTAYMNEMTKAPPEKWWDFLIKAGFFALEIVHSETGADKKCLVFMDDPSLSIPIEGTESKREKSEAIAIADGYDAYKSLPPAKRVEVYKEFIVRWGVERDEG